MFNKILLAYNGSREGKSALLACAEIASFGKSDTHLLAVAGMPSSMFLTEGLDRKSTRLNSSHRCISYAVFCLKKKKKKTKKTNKKTHKRYYKTTLNNTRC